MEDDQGFLWISTDHGIARFDGYGFEVLTESDGLSDNSILGTYKDYQGRIWFYSFSRRLSYLDGDSIRLFHTQDALYKPKVVITSMHVGKDGTVWLGNKSISRNFLLKGEPGGGYTLVDPEDTLVSAIKLLEDGGLIYSGSYRSDELLVDDKGTTYRYRFESINEDQSQKTELAVLQLRNGELLIVSRYQVVKYHNGIFTPVSYIEWRNNLGLLEDRSGNIWVALEGGGVLVYRKGDFSRPPEQLLEGTRVSHIEQDREGGIWLSTLEQGVFYMASQSLLALDSKRFFDGDRLEDILAGGRKLIVTSSQGNAYGIEVKPDQSLMIDRENVANTNLVLRGIYSDSLAIMFHTSRDNNPPMYIPYGIFPLRQLQPAEAYDFPRMLNRLSDSTHLASLHGFAGVFNTPKLQFDTISDLASKKPWFSAAAVGDTFWFSDRFSLWSYSNGAMAEWRDWTGYHPFFDHRMEQLESSGNRLYIASKSRGLVIKEGGKVWNIGKKDGLLSDICNHIEIDSDGDVWVCTNEGLSRIVFPPNDAKPKIINYSGVTSLISNQVHKVAIIDDTLIFALSEQGISIINKKQLDLEPIPPLVYITDILVNDQKTTVQELDLSYEQRSISVRFTGLSYRFAGKLRYRYRLLGLDTIWRNTTARQIDYAELAPGAYTFQVQVENAFGLTSEAYASGSFQIHPPIWQRWWFRLLIGAALVTMIFLVVNYQLNKVRNENRLKLAYLESEQKALRVQITPHFIFNSINSILGLITEHKNEKAKLGLAHFARLMRMVLQLSEHRSVVLSEELEAMQLYLNLERLRFDEQFQYQINVDPAIDPDFVELPPMVIQPYVENAIKHGLNHKLEGSKTVDLDFALENDVLVVSIRDNGIGRAASRAIQEKERIKRSGKGMKISEERIRILNETLKTEMEIKVTDLYDDQGHASGTLVVIRFPQNEEL